MGGLVGTLEWNDYVRQHFPVPIRGDNPTARLYEKAAREWQSACREEAAAVEGAKCCNYFGTECAGPAKYRTYGDDRRMFYFLCERHYREYGPGGPAAFPDEPPGS
jgi:hypothetical protein